MARPRKNSDRWKDYEGGSAFVIPVALLRHPNCTRLSAFANKLLMDLSRQFSGFNNGYLCASWSLMKQSGWRSSATLRLAMLELEHYRLIERTRQGGRNKAQLHALTWRRIDEKPGNPLDFGPTLSPSHAWKDEAPPFDALATAEAA